MRHLRIGIVIAAALGAACGRKTESAPAGAGSAVALGRGDKMELEGPLALGGSDVAPPPSPHGAALPPMTDAEADAHAARAIALMDDLAARLGPAGTDCAKVEAALRGYLGEHADEHRALAAGNERMSEAQLASVDAKVGARGAAMGELFDHAMTACADNPAVMRLFAELVAPAAAIDTAPQ